MMVTFRRALLFALAFGSLAFTAAACGDDDTQSDSSAQQSDIDTITARVQRDEVVFALKAIGDLPLHDMDEAINAGEVESSFLPNARDVVRYIGVTDWPTALDSAATDLQNAAIELVTALDAGDTEAAKQPATDLHELWHDFDHDAWAEIGGDLPPEAGTQPEEDDHGSETPAAEGTSSDGATPSETQDHGG
jgi:hypothetical protein